MGPRAGGSLGNGGPAQAPTRPGQRAPYKRAGGELAAQSAAGCRGLAAAHRARPPAARRSSAARCAPSDTRPQLPAEPRRSPAAQEPTAAPAAAAAAAEDEERTFSGNLARRHPQPAPGPDCRRPPCVTIGGSSPRAGVSPRSRPTSAAPSAANRCAHHWELPAARPAYTCWRDRGSGVKKAAWPAADPPAPSLHEGRGQSRASPSVVRTRPWSD